MLIDKAIGGGENGVANNHTRRGAFAGAETRCFLRGFCGAERAARGSLRSLAAGESLDACWHGCCSLVKSVGREIWDDKDGFVGSPVATFRASKTSNLFAATDLPPVNQLVNPPAGGFISTRKIRLTLAASFLSPVRHLSGSHRKK
ncbi:MAG: hypothetical protein ABR554_01130 [Pyrinomonadaceae bacterium]